MIEDRTFLSGQVADIVRISGRQVISWTEKGVIEPHKDSTGTGVRREYDYVNLLEFGLCKALFSMGFSFRTLKVMIAKLKGNSTIRSWVEDFQAYYRKFMEDHLKVMNEFLSDLKNDPTTVNKFRDYYDRLLIKRWEPEKSGGLLIYFWGEHETDLEVKIYPREFDYILNINKIKGDIVNFRSSLVIDIGRIKNEIDQKL